MGGISHVLSPILADAKVSILYAEVVFRVRLLLCVNAASLAFIYNLEGLKLTTTTLLSCSLN